ncbi:helix-turn-helix transcriptional regulator [bacterium]|nr:helix-turn-helix transcriptional regulator [bacterium]
MNQSSKINIAKNIQKLRNKKHITKENLSLTLGFDNSYISKVENLKMNITIEKLDKIANYFEIETYKLLK